jgi:tripartite-type tricarboxylate transporter receptor subunit TctC
MKRRTALTLATAWALGAPRLARAQAASFPDRPLRLIIPFAAGGSNDIVGRLIADRMAARLGRPIVIENRGGAGGLIGNDAVAKAPADGTTMLLAGSGSFLISSLVQPRLPYDPERDFAPIGLIGAAPNVIVVHPSMAAQTLGDLQRVARASRRPLRYGTPGVGTTGHALGAMIGVVLGVELDAVHYRGTGPSMTDALAGRIDILTNASAPLQPHIEAGRLRAIAVAGRTRSAALPQIPTSLEQGFPELDSATWYALLITAGAPPERIAALHHALNEVLADPEVRHRLMEHGVDDITPSPEPADLTRFLTEERARWRRIVERAQLRIE